MSRAAVLLLSLSPLLACSGASDEASPSGETGGAAELSVQTAALDFGDVSVLSDGSLTLQVSLENTGDAALEVSALVIEGDDAFTVGAMFPPFPGPGESALIPVTFAPTGDISASADLVIASNSAGGAEVVVPLSGEGLAPQLSLSAGQLDFGDQLATCAVSETLVLESTGREPLNIDSVALLGDNPQVMIDLMEESNGPLPWALAPGEERTVAVGYLPLDELGLDAVLVVSSDAPEAPEAQVPLAGRGVDAEAVTDTLDVGDGLADVVFAVDKSCSMSDDISNMLFNISELTDTLGSLGASYRIAFVVNDSGDVYGAVPYIDPDNADDVESISAEMLSGPYGSSTEKAFTLFEAALGTSGSKPGAWIREGAALHLIGVSDEPEQSRARSWSGYVDLYESLTGNPVTIHGVGGDVPKGCSSASAYTGLYEATVSTGGTFHSICEANWSVVHYNLAAAIAEALSGQLVLSQPALEESLVVSVNGIPLDRGWSYDAERQAVTVTLDQFDEGDTITATYLAQAECEG